MDLEKKAIERIKLASEMSLQHYGVPLVCTYSGGKDSDVVLELFRRSGVPYEVHNSHTTVDAPQTIYHIRQKFGVLENLGIKATVEKPVYKGQRCSMWTLIPEKKTPPTRMKRYCCSVLKETGCPIDILQLAYGGMRVQHVKIGQHTKELQQRRKTRLLLMMKLS